MKLMTFTLERVRAMKRPPGYVDGLAACAVEKTADAMTVDVEGECFAALDARYAGHTTSPAGPTPVQTASPASAVADTTARRETTGRPGGCGCRGRRLTS